MQTWVLFRLIYSRCSYFRDIKMNLYIRTKVDIFQHSGSKLRQKTPLISILPITTLTPLFSHLKYEKIKKITNNLQIHILKTGDVIQKSKKRSLWAFLCSTNQCITNFEITYHFREFLHLVSKTRQMR